MSFLDKMKEAGDKASKSMADSYKQHQEKVAELKDTRGNKLASLTVEYMGGYGNYKKSAGSVTFYQNQTEFKSFTAKFTILNGQIADVAIEGKDEVNRRVTVTRLLAVGIFAFALKKKSKDKEAYLTLVLSDGQEVIMHIKDKSPMELRSKLAQVISHVKQASTASAQTAVTSGPQLSVADELAKLAALKDQGILTQAKFDTKKAQLLQ